MRIGKTENGLVVTAFVEKMACIKFGQIVEAALKEANIASVQASAFHRVVLAVLEASSPQPLPSELEKVIMEIVARYGKAGALSAADFATYGNKVYRDLLEMQKTDKWKQFGWGNFALPDWPTFKNELKNILSKPQNQQLYNQLTAPQSTQVPPAAPQAAPRATRPFETNVPTRSQIPQVQQRTPQRRPMRAFEG